MTRLRRSFLCRVLACTLALLVPVHAISVAIAGALGPNHVHRTAPGATPVLDDARRIVATATAAHEHRASAPEPVHAHARPTRHHHAAADASVEAGDSLQPLADDDGSVASLLTAPLMAMLPTVLGWQAPERSSVLEPCDEWAAITHASPPTARPPRAA